MIAKLCGCKLLFVSVGAGPIYGRLSRWFVKKALASADFRSYRDNSTLQYLEKCDLLTGKDQVYPDLAFSLPEAFIRRGVNIKTRPVIGLGLMQEAGRYGVIGRARKLITLTWTVLQASSNGCLRMNTMCSC